MIFINYYIKKQNFITKTLEFLCNSDKDMSEDDFQKFIKDMMDIGFNSKTILLFNLWINIMNLFIHISFKQ